MFPPRPTVYIHISGIVLIRKSCVSLSRLTKTEAPLLFFLLFFFPQVPSTFSFQARSPISYLGNTFSTSVKFILVTLLVFPAGESRQRKGSHYGLVVRPHRRGKSGMSTAISHISSGTRLLWRLHLCSKHLKRLPRLPSLFLLLAVISLFAPLSLPLFSFFSSPDSAGLIFLNCLTPKIQISQSGPLSF